MTKTSKSFERDARRRFERSMGTPVNGPDDVDRLARQGSPVRLSFADEVVEALDAYVDAKLDFAEARRGPNAEFASYLDVDNAKARLGELLALAQVK